MNQDEIRAFAESYFRSFQSTFVEEHPAYFSVQLPVEVDKDIGNRPFYWSYVEKMGITPNLITLNLIFDPSNCPDGVRGDAMTFGSRRLLQLFGSAKKHGQFVRLYELPKQAPAKGSTPLAPWLCANYKIEFICDQKRDVLVPLGINLITGEVQQNFYQKVRQLPLTPKLPDYSFTMQPIFGIDTAVAKLESFIQALLDKEETEWAELAKERLEEEKAYVESYYQEETNRQHSTEEDAAKRQELEKQLISEKETRLNELIWQFEPKIEVEIVNAGLFYLSHTVH
jgi:hypothetical protein